MSGIAGVAYGDTGRFPDRDLLQAMTVSLAHRGPDGEGFHLEAGIGLGVRLLGIVEPGTCDQPAYNEARSVAIVCDGAIFNSIELRRELEAAGHHLHTRSDAEVIAHLYEDYGLECVHELRGTFAFALWDARRRLLLLARDRLGIKPLYYAEISAGLAFGSEQKALLTCPAIPRDVNLQGLQDLVSFGFVVGPKTMFTAIRQLSPGCRLIYSQGRASIDRYWELPGPSLERQDRRRSTSQWAEMVFDKLDEVVCLHLRSGSPVGAWLSGGLDSSTVVSLMRRHIQGPIPVSLLSFKGLGLDEVHGQRTLLDHPQYDLQARICTCCSDDLRRIPEALWYFEEPTGSGLEVVRLLLAEASSQDAKVVLSGEGADEVFGGYHWFLLDKVVHAASPLPLIVRRALAAAPLFPGRFVGLRRLLVDPRPMGFSRYRDTAIRFPDGMADHLLSPVARSQLASELSSAEEPVMPPEFPVWDRFSQFQYYEVHVRLASLVLNTLDRGGTARSLEVRAPFLDHELVELASRIPPQLKLRWRSEKYILRRAVRGILPREIAGRRKYGLRAPVAAWLRADLPEFASELLSESELRRTAYFDPATVARLVSQHRNGQHDWGHRLMGVLVMQLWDRIFVRGNGALL